MSGPYAGLQINNQPSVDASHTSKVFLDPLMPGVALGAASGHDHGTAATPPVSAVLEPALMLGGLAVVVGARRASARPSHA